MQRGPNLGDFVIFSRGIHTIRQENNEKLPVGINPDRSSRKTSVPETMCRKVVPARATFGRHHPTERARSARKLLRHYELRNRRAAQYSLVRISAAIQQHLAKRRQIRRRTEEPCMARNAANGICVFIVHFALDKPLAEIP